MESPFISSVRENIRGDKEVEAFLFWLAIAETDWL